MSDAIQYCPDCETNVMCHMERKCCNPPSELTPLAWSVSLFIPLKTEYYEQFERGWKRIEYRKHGKRWNAQTCAIGRPVTLSKGYGKKHRLKGVITGFDVRKDVTHTEAWRDCYGTEPTEAACITIALQDDKTPTK